MNATFDLACSLIAQASVTPDDKDCQRLIRSVLAPLGFTCETITCGNVTNLWARHGNTAPLIVFAGQYRCRPAGTTRQMDVRSLHADRPGRSPVRTGCRRHENLGGPPWSSPQGTSSPPTRAIPVPSVSSSPAMRKALPWTAPTPSSNCWNSAASWPITASSANRVP